VIHEQNSRHRIQISDSKSKESLYDLICSTHKALEKSKISGMTVVFTYTNKHGSSFTIALSGLNNIDDLESDKGKITRWLDQFFKIVVYRKGNCIEKLPVIFGGDIKTINMTADREIAVILSDKQINQITKRVVYKALVQTPVYITTELGRVSLHTPTFRNHVVFHINSRENIKDGPKLSIVLDSIKYLIFGANYAGVN
jgi:hypothetical protein